MSVYRRNNPTGFGPEHLAAWQEDVDELYNVLGGRSEQRINHDSLIDHNANNDYQHVTAAEKAAYDAAQAYAENLGTTHTSHQHQIEIQRFTEANVGAITLIYEPLPNTIIVFVMTYPLSPFKGKPTYKLLLPEMFTYTGNRMNIINGIPKNTILHIDYAYKITI